MDEPPNQSSETENNHKRNHHKVSEQPDHRSVPSGNRNLTRGNRTSNNKKKQNHRTTTTTRSTIPAAAAPALMYVPKGTRVVEKEGRDSPASVPAHNTSFPDPQANAEKKRKNHNKKKSSAQNNQPRTPQQRSTGVKAAKEEKKTPNNITNHSTQNNNNNDNNGILPISQIELQGNSTLAADIMSRLQQNQYECMICTDVIKRTSAIWHCSTCYTLFHLYCTKRWAENAIQSTEQALKKNSNVYLSSPWRCPACQTTSNVKPVPYCFCGKVRDPKFDPYVLPHSCGESCGRKRAEHCPHPCSEICHPGPCPKCSSLGDMATCYCGAVEYRLRCGEASGKSCGAICGKKLNCGIHQCQAVCHAGPCQPCQVDVKMKCYCRKKEEVRKCGSGKLDTSEGEARYFSCGDVCGNLLECDNHQCQQRCHPGGIDACGECPLLPQNLKTCPCGKLPIKLIPDAPPRKSCLDAIPTCPNTCGKKLPACAHACQTLCHTGPCPPCQQIVNVSCNCGSKRGTAKCSERSSTKFVCNVQCKTFKSCGRHKCTRACCPAAHGGIDPSDTQGLHICSLPCDKLLKCGKHKCQLLCHSGKCPACHVTNYEDYVCECGKTRLEAPWFCGTKPPTCNFPCMRKRSCGHSDGHLCHSRETPCPPCEFKRDVLCYGGHEVRKYIPCHLGGVGCGRACGKPLLCGVHKCIKSCHSGACIDNDPQGRPLCPQKCLQVRKCGHPCRAKCHGTDPCPPEPCTAQVTLYCKCKGRSLLSECLKVGRDDEEDRMLECSDECIKNERNKRFAEALGITPRQQTYYRYSDFLMGYAKDYPSVCSKIEKAFGYLLNSKEMSHSFAAMSKEGRRFVHELAENYHLHSDSYDPEPRRHVVVTKKQTTRLPPVLLSVSVTQTLPPHWAQLNARSKKEHSSTQPAPRATVSSVSAQPSYSNNNNNNNSNSSSNNNNNNNNSNTNDNNIVSLTEVPNAIHFFGLGPDVKSEHLSELLADFEGKYHLKWIDEQNCIACFKTSAANWVHAALVKVQDNSAFHVQTYTGDPPIPEKAKVESSASAPVQGVEVENVSAVPAAEPTPQTEADSGFTVPKRLAVSPSSLASSSAVPTWAQQLRSPANNNRFSSLSEENDVESRRPAHKQRQPSPTHQDKKEEQEKQQEQEQEQEESLRQSTEQTNLLGKSVDDWEDSILE